MLQHEVVVEITDATVSWVLRARLLPGRYDWEILTVPDLESFREQVLWRFRKR